MIESSLFYLDFFKYMITTLFRKNKLENLKINGTEEEIQQYINKSVKDWSEHVLSRVHANIEIIGKENITKETCLYVSNHQGYFDIPILLSIFDRPVGFIAKKEILKFKILSYWMQQINCIFIDRKDVRESVKSINQGIEILKSGHSMVIFPEGTRSKGATLGQFKKGSMKLALKSGVPIVPVVIDGSYKLLEKNKEYNKDERKVKITICKPVYLGKLSKEERVNLAENIREIISKNIENK